MVIVTFFMYREAVEHFLTALNLQQQAKGVGGGSKQAHMSESIWSTLGLAISLVGRPDLKEPVHSRNLNLLMREFGID